MGGGVGGCRPIRRAPNGRPLQRAVRLPLPVLAGMLATIMLVAAYGPRLAAGGVLVPSDMLEAFPPWSTDSPRDRPENGLLGDQVQQMYPWRAFAQRELAEGRLPLWNPYAGAGVPLLANGQSALLFPLNALTVWLPPEIGATVAQLAKPPLAAIGAALFLRALGAGAFASSFTGLAWAFSGPMVTWLGWPHTNALLMVPYLFWTATRWLQTRAWAWWMASTLCVAIQLLGGHPETTAHTLFVLGLYVVAFVGARFIAPEAGGRDESRPYTLIVGWGASLAVGTALAAVQVLPTLAVIPDSVTTAERGTRSLARVVLAQETIATWLVPNFFGTPLATAFGALAYLNYNETIGYVGLGTLALAAVSLVYARRPGWLGLGVVTLVAIGLTYGVPLITELRWLPGLRHAANTRFVFIAAFGLVCLAGLGLDACVRDRRRWPAAMGAAILVLVVGAGAAGLALSPDTLLPTEEGAAPLQPVEAVLWRQGELWRTAGVATLWAGCLALLAVMRPRRIGFRPSASVPLLAVLGTLGADLLLFGARYNPVLPPDAVRNVPTALAFLKEQGSHYRVIGLGEALLPNAGTLLEIPDFRVYEPVAHRRFLPYFEQIDPFLKTDIRSRFYLFVWHPNVDLLTVAGVRWILTSRWDERTASAESLAAAGLVERYRDRGVSVWENPRARPRAYLADVVIAAEDEVRALSAVVGKWPRGSLATFVEPPIPGTLGTQDVFRMGRVDWEAWPGRMRLRVSAPDGGLLVVNEAYYPGWSGWVDDVPVSILHANYLFMGIPLPPGDHVVMLEYRPPALLAGTAVSGVTALALGTCLLVGLRRRRSDRDGPPGGLDGLR